MVRRLLKRGGHTHALHIPTPRLRGKVEAKRNEWNINKFAGVEVRCARPQKKCPSLGARQRGGAGDGHVPIHWCVCGDQRCDRRCFARQEKACGYDDRRHTSCASVHFFSICVVVKGQTDKHRPPNSVWLDLVHQLSLAPSAPSSLATRLSAWLKLSV
jgi:hypothetical protein